MLIPSNDSPSNCSFNYQWESCKVEGLRLNPEADTWLAIDLSPSRKEAALVASQRLQGDKFQVILLQTWSNPANLDDKAMANDVAEWVRKYPVQLVAYSARTASAVAARLAPETWYSNFRGQTCVRTSYNGKIRYNYAAVGYTYDPIDDAFIAPMPECGHDELILNNDKQWRCSNPEHKSVLDES